MAFIKKKCKSIHKVILSYKLTGFTLCSTETHTELKISNPRILELVRLQQRKNRRKVKLVPQDWEMEGFYGFVGRC